MISYKGVFKTYGYLLVLNGVTADFEPGVVHALVGPNGSGKSTMLRMAVGLTRPDHGEVSVAGLNPAREPERVKRIVGYVPEEVSLYESLTPAETFSLVSWAYGLGRGSESRIDWIVDLFGLRGDLNRLVGELSLGTKRRLMIGLALTHDPRVLIMDEPFSGLGPEGAIIVKEILRRSAEEGRTVLFSTHILELAEAVADIVTILHRGSVVARGSPEDLRDLHEASSLEGVFMKSTKLDRRLRKILTILRGE